MSVKSAQRVLEIFELLTQYPQGLTVKEISEFLDLPQSSTFNLVKTLYENNYLTQGELKKYKLGPKLIHIGASARESLDIHSVGAPHLKLLMEQVQETVFLAVLSKNEIVYIAKIDSNRSIRTSAQPGYRKPLYCTGLGKAFLTFMPRNEQKKYLDNTEFVKFTKKTITDRELLKKQLDNFKHLGYAFDDEENEEGLYCLAAPIYGVDGMMIAAISVAGPKERMLARKEKIINHLLITSNKISAGLGYTNQKNTQFGGATWM